MTTTLQNFKRRETTISLNKVKYTGFPIGYLPKRFAFIYDAENDQEGLTSWFNYKGLTYIRNSDLKTGW
jgi:hypothetical protein